MISRKWWSSCDSSQHQCPVGVDSPIAEPDGCPVAGNKRTIVGIAVDHTRGVTLRDRAAPGRAETITPVGILERDSQPLCRANGFFRRTGRGNLRWLGSGCGARGNTRQCRGWTDRGDRAGPSHERRNTRRRRLQSYGGANCEPVGTGFKRVTPRSDLVDLGSPAAKTWSRDRQHQAVAHRGECRGEGKCFPGRHPGNLKPFRSGRRECPLHGRV